MSDGTLRRRATAYPAASPPNSIRCATRIPDAELLPETLPRKECSDSAAEIETRRRRNTARFVESLSRACGWTVASYAVCVAVFYATVAPAPPEADPLVSLMTFSQCTASCFGTAMFMNLLMIFFEDDGQFFGGGDESASARVAPIKCIMVINGVSCASHLCIAWDLLPRHVMFDGRQFHSARWAEWTALVPLLMVLMHGLSFDPNGPADAPVLDGGALRSIAAQEASTILGCVCSLWDLPTPVAFCCLILSTVAYCHIFKVLAGALREARVAFATHDDAPQTVTDDVLQAGRRLRAARTALLTVVCAGTWTLFRKLASSE